MRYSQIYILAALTGSLVAFAAFAQEQAEDSAQKSDRRAYNRRARMVETPFSITYEEDVEADEYDEEAPSGFSIAPDEASYNINSMLQRSYAPSQRTRPQEEDEDSQNWILPPTRDDDESVAPRETGWGWLADETRRRLAEQGEGNEDEDEDEDDDDDDEGEQDYTDPFDDEDDGYGVEDEEAALRPSGEQEDSEDEEGARWEPLSVSSWATEDEPVVGDRSEDDIRNMERVVGDEQDRTAEEDEQLAAQIWQEAETSPEGDAYLSRTRQALADIEQSLPDLASRLESMSVAPLEDLTSRYGLSILTEGYGGDPDIQQPTVSPGWSGGVDSPAYDGGGFRGPNVGSGAFSPGGGLGRARSPGGTPGVGAFGPGQPALPMEPARPLNETSGRGIGIDALTR